MMTAPDLPRSRNRLIGQFPLNPRTVAAMQYALSSVLRTCAEAILHEALDSLIANGLLKSQEWMGKSTSRRRGRTSLTLVAGPAPHILLTHCPCLNTFLNEVISPLHCFHLARPFD
jgi:hypothetical protein